MEIRRHLLSSSENWSEMVEQANRCDKWKERALFSLLIDIRRQFVANQTVVGPDEEADWINPRPHMLFSHPRTHMGGGLQPRPCHFASNWDRTAGQRPNESLGCCESNDTRVLFRSYRDPSRSGQRKKDGDLRIYVFFANNFQTKKDSGIIQAPSCFSLQDASKHILFDLERSSWKFDLRSK